MTSDELFDEWRHRREREGERMNLMELHELCAESLGVEPEDLPPDLRREPASPALAVV